MKKKTRFFKFGKFGKLVKSLKLMPAALLALVVALSLSPAARAGHVGGYLGPSFFMNSGSDSTYLTGGVDAAFNLLPSLEIGAFYHHIAITNAAMTQVGGEVDLYPLLIKSFFVGGKLGNASQSGTDRLTYALCAGLNIDLAPAFTFGVDGDYFFYNGTGMTDFALLGSLKFWF